MERAAPLAPREAAHANTAQFSMPSLLNSRCDSGALLIARQQLPRLADVDRVTGEPRRRGPVTPRRYERERPGELVHVDVKKVARIPPGGGWRARGADALRHADSGAGTACLHVAVDDHSRVAYAELLGDERKETCVAFMGRARDFYRGLGVEVERVTADNGPGYRSRLFNEWLAASGIAHRYTRPYSPWQNGKVERMNRTLAQEWQYARLRQRGGEGGRPPCSWNATIEPGPTAPAGASRRCHASLV